MSARSSSKPSLYITISNVVSDFGTVVILSRGLFFVGLHWWRWEGHWKSSCAGEPSGSTWVNEWIKTEIQGNLTDLPRQWILPYATGEKKALLERATKESCTQKLTSVYSKYTSAVALHTEARATRMASLRLGNQRPWCQEHRNFSLQGSLRCCTCWLQKGKKLDGNLNSWRWYCTQLLASLRGSRFFEAGKLDRWYCACVYCIIIEVPLDNYIYSIFWHLRQSKKVVTNEHYSFFWDPININQSEISIREFQDLQMIFMHFHPRLGYPWTLNPDLCSFCLKILDLRDVDSQICTPQHTRNSTPDLLIPWLQGSCFDKTEQDIINANVSSSWSLLFWYVENNHVPHVSSLDFRRYIIISSLCVKT